MRKTFVLALALAMLLLALPSATAGKPVRAFGHGKLVEHRNFSFVAMELRNGDVGHGSLVWTADNYKSNTKFEVDCLAVDGHMATVTGLVTHSTGEDASVPVGDRFWFRVFDNGWSRSSGVPDEMTYFLWESELPKEPWPEDCDSQVIPHFGNLVLPVLPRGGEIRVSG